MQVCSLYFYSVFFFLHFQGNFSWKIKPEIRPYSICKTLRIYRYLYLVYTYTCISNNIYSKEYFPMFSRPQKRKKFIWRCIKSKIQKRYSVRTYYTTGRQLQTTLLFEILLSLWPNFRMKPKRLQNDITTVYRSKKKKIISRRTYTYARV